MDFTASANSNIKRYIEQLRAVKMALYADLSAQYKKSVDLELASVLAAQVINYLMGEDIEEVYQNTPEPLRSKIGQIKDQISIQADKKMRDDAEVRELIVYTLRMEDVYRLGALGEEYYTSAEKSRIDKFLDTYGKGYPMEVTPTLYSLVVTRFLENKLHIFEGGGLKN